MSSDKPLSTKAYGHIPHLPGSRLDPGDHKVTPGQAQICMEKARDKNDRIIVQEKTDGSCCSVCKLDSQILPLVRAESSRFEQHRLFANWVYENYVRFDALLAEGERLVGEWLAQAHGTRYDLQHEPFVVFDLMRGQQRAPFAESNERVQGNFVAPHLLQNSGPCSINRVQELLAGGGGHGALDGPEGAVWRVRCRREQA